MSEAGFSQSSDRAQITEDEDSHLCLRCRNTIIGLDNYVVHRKNSCHPVVNTENSKDDENTNDSNKESKAKLSISSPNHNQSDDMNENYNQILDSQPILSPIFQDLCNSVSTDNVEVNNPPKSCIESDTKSILDVKESEVNRNVTKSFSTKKANTSQRLNEIEMTTELSESQLKIPIINSSVSENNEGSLYCDNQDPSIDSNLSQDKNLGSPSSLNTSNATLQQHLIHHSYESSPSINNESGTNEDVQTARNVEPNLKIKNDSKKRSSTSVFPLYENKKKHDLDCEGRKHSASQTPFTNFTDPLLHSQDNTNIFRQFEGFGDQGKTSQVGSPITPIFSKNTTNNYEIENPKTSFDLESHNFDSRYQDFYSIQSSSQESLLSSNHLMNISDKRNNCNSQEIKNNQLQIIGCLPDPHTKRPEEVETLGYHSSGTYNSSVSPLLPEHESATATDMVKDEVLRQDDFLSSLELRSRPKILTKPSANDEEDEEYDDDEMCPPRHHTGGKWRPGLHAQASISLDWRSCTQRSEVEEEGIDEDHVDEDEDLRPLPPSYTKGKWLPGKRITNKGSMNSEHFCQPCNRKLRDRNTYDRHLQTQFHFINEGKAKANLAEKSGGDDQKSSLRSRPVRLKRIAAQKFLKNTIAKLKNKKICNEIDLNEINENKMSDGNKETHFVENQNIICKESLRRDFKEDSSEEEMESAISSTQKLMCPICRLSFGASYVSLHFASLAHIHNELEHRHDPKQNIKEEYNSIILKYIDEIVKTSYFKCNVCKFYCNLHEDLYVHMKTHNDETTDYELKNVYTCSSFQDENAMQIKDFLRHLETPHHKQNVLEEVLLARQVTVDSKTAVTCSLCNKHFRYLHAYRKHRRIFHEEPDFQLSHQRLLSCPECDFKAPDYKLIRSHLRENHEHQENDLTYYCFVCGLGFKSLQEAESHRRSVFHRTTVGRQKGLSVRRTCNMCYEDVPDLATLRTHMVEKHGSECSPCHVCGYVPPLRADLAQHQRNCKGEVLNVEGKYKCQLCPFRNNLLAHVLSHTTLSHGTSDSDTRFSCHICKTKLRATSVKGHMLTHSNEWPHGCHLCSRKFPLQEWLSKHLTTVHHRGNAQANAQTHQLCHLCGATFTNRPHLARHLQQHHGHALLGSPKETISDKLSPNKDLKSCKDSNAKILCHLCGHEAESPSYMKIHMRGHRVNNGGKLDCPHCNYVTSHLPHLRRHLRLHTGARPFVCPYCSYECNNQENLRKHMLKTKLHPGRFMYECRLCIDSSDLKLKEELSTEIKNVKDESEVYVFKSNYSKELHSHLLQHHQAHFINKEQVTAHIRSYYHPETDITVTNNPKPYFHKKRKRSWGLIQKDGADDVAMEVVPEDEAGDNEQSSVNNAGLPAVSNAMVNIQIVDSSNPSRHQMDNSDTLLKQVKQILKEEQISKGDQSPCRQVIMIVPDEIVGSVGELASLLPSLGLQTSSDNISVLTLNNDEVTKSQQMLQGNSSEVIQEKSPSFTYTETYSGNQFTETQNKIMEIDLPSKSKLPNQIELSYLEQEQKCKTKYQVPNLNLNNADGEMEKQTVHKPLIINDDNENLQSNETIKQTKLVLEIVDNKKKDNNVISEDKATSKNTTHAGCENTGCGNQNICREISTSALSTITTPQLIQGEMFVSKSKDENIPLKTNIEYKPKDNSDTDNLNFSHTLNAPVPEQEMQSIVLVENAGFEEEDTLIIHENLDFPQENLEIMQKGTHFIREISKQVNCSQNCNTILENKDNGSAINKLNSVDSQSTDEYEECLHRVRHNHKAGNDISVEEVSQSVEIVTSENEEGSQVIYTFTL